ncbi:MAG: hypothetical protein R2753_12915 [Chitinophagales bacterium]
MGYCYTIFTFLCLFSFNISVNAQDWDVNKRRNLNFVIEANQSAFAKMPVESQRDYLTQLSSDFDNNNLDVNKRHLIYSKTIEQMDFNLWPVDVKQFGLYLLDQYDLQHPTNHAYKSGKIAESIITQMLIEVPDLAAEERGTKLTLDQQYQLMRERMAELQAEGVNFSKYAQYFQNQ